MVNDEVEPGSPVDDQDIGPISWDAVRPFLKYALLALMGGALFFLTVLFLTAPEQTTRAIGPALMAMMAAAGLLFLRRGYAGRSALRQSDSQTPCRIRF